MVIDFASARRTSRPELIEDEYGHDDCFDWTGPVAVAGRLWVDPETHDVLRLDRHIGGPTDVRVPPRLQSKYRFPGWLTIDRDDLTLRFKPVAFSDPDEMMLLPESIESLTVLRTGLQTNARKADPAGHAETRGRTVRNPCRGAGRVVLRRRASWSSRTPRTARACPSAGRP